MDFNMTELRDYFQYQCDRCGFRARSPDEMEAIDVVQRHEKDKHQIERGQEEITAELRKLELEGLPDNS